MLKYIFRRILLFIPPLFFITLLAFLIKSATPGDPIMRLLGAESEHQESTYSYEYRYFEMQHEMGLDLPLFYFSFNSLAMPDLLHLIPNASYHKYIKELALETGNGREVIDYYRKTIGFVKNNPQDEQSQIQRTLTSGSAVEINEIINKITVAGKPSDLRDEWNDIWYGQAPWKRFVPVIKFHANNQYHRWLFGAKKEYGNINSYKGIVNGDFGKSYISGKSVTTILKERIGWTLFFTLGGLLISLSIAIPVGVKAATGKDNSFDRRSTKIILLLHSLPSFFTATLLLMIFANPSVLGWLPASGVGNANSNSIGFWQWLNEHVPYLILPLICYAAASLPFIMRAVRTSMIEELDKDYIVTARAKGLKKNDVTWKHAFRNALFPLITVIAWVFPAMVGGSAILETVFSIPGMGLEIVQGIYNRDYPLIIAVFTITGLLTVTGYLVSDILYTVADPRIKLT